MKGEFRELIINEVLNIFPDARERSGNLNIRCPICGDSERDSRKRRGWVLIPSAGSARDQIRYFCHNCGESEGIVRFIRRFNANFSPKNILFKAKMDDVAHSNQINEKIIDTVANIPNVQREIQKRFTDVLKGFTPLSNLPDEHVAKSMLLKRLVPRDRMDDIYYIDNLSTFYNLLSAEHPYCRKYIGSLDNNAFPGGAIAFPFRTPDGDYNTIQLRLFSGDRKYLTLSMLEVVEDPRILGLSVVDFEKPIIIVEGTIDSFNLENCVSAATSSQLRNVAEFIQKTYGSDVFLVYDRDLFNNKDVRKQMMGSINKGYKVYLYQQFEDLPISEVKDINDIVVGGHSDMKSLTTDILTESIGGLKAKFYISSKYPELT